jgi:hypothetical protein
VRRNVGQVRDRGQWDGNRAQTACGLTACQQTAHPEPGTTASQHLCCIEGCVGVCGGGGREGGSEVDGRQGQGQWGEVCNFITAPQHLQMQERRGFEAE